MQRSAISLAVALVALGAASFAQERKPPVPSGRDPGGIAVALLSAGIDYTLPSLVQRFARDGEGELIGWDLEDADRRPFDKSRGAALHESGGDGTAIANFLVHANAARVVAVRINPADPTSFARAVAFVAHTPARVAVLHMWNTKREVWEPLLQAATRFKETLLIIPASPDPEPTYLAAIGFDNILAVEPGTGDAEMPGFGGRMQRLSGAALAVAAAGHAATAMLVREPMLEARVLKRRLMATGGGAMWRARE